ncbi:condensation domain-containing protein, partial [Pseudomonas yamanorum]
MLKPDPLRSQEMLERIKGLEGHKRQQLFSKLAQSGVNVARLPILPASETGALPMSYAQQRQWFLWQLEPRSSAYNISSAIRLQGPLDAHVLARSVDHVVARHASLRTVFFEDNGQALQRVLPADSARVVVDNPALGAATPGQAIDQCLAVEAAWVFDLTQGPLMRVRLLNLGPDDHLLVVTVHHIITDGWSMGIMVQELLEYYRADLAGEVADLPALSIQYLDYAQWQRQWLEAGERERQLAYWQRQLAGEQSVLALPLDHVRPAVQSYGGASLDFSVPPALTERLRALAQHQDVSLFMLLLGAFQVLLFRYSGQTDIRVGVPVANRNRLETERLIGFFVNTQVFKADLDGTRGFDSFLQDVRRIAQEAQDHQDLPFEQLVQALHPERSLSHSPLFQVMYNHQQGSAGAGAQVGDLHVQAVPRPQVSSQFDLTLDVSEPVDPGQGLAATFTYATDLFEAASVERLSRHWLNLLHAIVANPAQSLGELPLLDAYEQRELSQGWNTTATVYPLERAVHQLIADQVARTPQAIALQFGEQQLTYRELDQRANQLAHQLISLGVGPEVLVGLAMERSLEMVIGLLAVLKAGGAYVPLDPDYPTERLAYMIEDSAIGLLLSQRRLLAQLPIPAGLATLCLDEPGAEAFPATCPGISLAPENLAYVIYTSGSTGKPKGAGNRHKALTNRLCWMQQAYRLTADDAVLQKTPFSFDVSVWEFFWPLMSGARLVVAAPGDHREPTKLVQLITARQITTLHFVPSMLQVFLQDAQVSQCASLTRIV